MKNVDGALKSSKSQRPAKAGLSVFPEILAELPLVRDISSNMLFSSNMSLLLRMSL